MLMVDLLSSLLSFVFCFNKWKAKFIEWVEYFTWNLLNVFFPVQLLCLDSLSAYWNIQSKMYYHGSREQILVM